MQELNGFIKLFRKFKKWGWYQNSIVKSVFLHCLLSASYCDFEWMGEKYKAGEFSTSLENMSRDLGISVQRLRTALKKLQGSGEIFVNSTNKFTLIKVVKWGNYQDYDTEANNQITNKQQSSNNQITINQQHIKNKENKKNKKKENSFSAYPKVPNLAELYKEGLL